MSRQSCPELLRVPAPTFCRVTWQRMLFSEPLVCIGVEGGRAQPRTRPCWHAAREQAVQRGQTGAAPEDAVEPRAQRETAAVAGAGLVSLQIGIEVPDQLAHMLLGSTVQIGEGVQLVHQPFGMHPAQRVSAHGELPGIVT